ncbi:unnamed protein product [Arctogadus glacialis]
MKGRREGETRHKEWKQRVIGHTTQPLSRFDEQSQRFKLPYSCLLCGGGLWTGNGEGTKVKSPRGLLQESFVEEPDGLVSVNLLVVSAVSAFATGAVVSGLAVCWIMSHRHRRARAGGAAGGGARRKGDKEQSMLGQGRSGSVMSVTRTSGGERRRSQQADNPFVAPHGWPGGDMDPDLLPTPEQTPLQQKRVLRLADGDWDQSQVYLTALGSPCANNAVIYLSSKYLQGGGGGGGGGVLGRLDDSGEVVVLPAHPERQRYLVLAPQRGDHGGGGGGGGRGGPGPLRSSAGEYNYPATPQDSPDRRRVVSAPTPHADYGEAPRWSHEALSYTGGGGAPYPPRGQQGLVRPGVHGPPDYGHLLGKGGGPERTPSGQ